MAKVVTGREMTAYPSTTLILVRHAQARASDGSYDPRTPLSELGRLQAAALAGGIAEGIRPAAVYTSPFARAVETSASLCERLGLEALVDPRLAEFEIEDWSLESAEDRLDLLIWRPEHTGARDGETLREFFARVAAFCGEVAERHTGECVVIVAHAGTIDAAVRWALGLAPESPWQHECDTANGSITELEIWPCGRVREGAPRYAVLRRVGDAAHLGNLVTEL